MGAAIVAAGALVVVPSAVAAVPRTVVRARAPIVAVALDGGTVAWRVRHPTQDVSSCNDVHVKRLASGLSSRVVECVDRAEDGTQVALAAGSVFWDRLRYSFESCCDSEELGRIGEWPLAPQWLASARRTRDCGGATLGPLAARGPTLVYARQTWTVTGPIPAEGCGHEQPGDAMTGGAVYVVSDASRMPNALVGSPASAAVVVGGGRIALVPYALTGSNGRPPHAAAVELWDTAARTHVTTLTMSGPARAIALGGGTLAVLVGNRIERYDAADGDSLGSSAPIPGIAPRLAARGNAIVYAVSRRIFRLDAQTGAIRQLARTVAAPTSLALGRCRLAWVENPLAHGRVRTLAVRTC